VTSSSRTLRNFTWGVSVRRFFPANLVRLWQQLLAITRMSLSAVCEQSRPLGPHDFHTYADDVDGVPWGMQGGGRCHRCGKQFRL